LARIGENWHTPPSFCALAFHDGRHNRDDTADDLTTSHKNLVDFGPVALSFAGTFEPAGLPLGFATHFQFDY